MTAVDAPSDGPRRRAPGLARRWSRWLETGAGPTDLFADDVFADLTLPQWRVQAQGTDATFHLREDSHPYPGDVRVEALDRTARGFLIQFEERWEAEGQRWYCRELMHCAVTDGRISEWSVYCTGDWDEAVSAPRGAGAPPPALT